MKTMDIINRNLKPLEDKACHKFLNTLDSHSQERFFKKYLSKEEYEFWFKEFNSNPLYRDYIDSLAKEVIQIYNRDKEDQEIKNRVKRLCDILEIDHIGLINEGIKRLMEEWNKVK